MINMYLSSKKYILYYISKDFILLSYIYLLIKVIKMIGV
jgi:hypothetical protein